MASIHADATSSIVAALIAFQHGGWHTSALLASTIVAALLALHQGS